MRVFLLYIFENLSITLLSLIMQQIIQNLIVRKLSYEMCKILLLNGANVNVVDKDGKNPLHIVACRWNSNVVKLLTQLSI